MLWMERFAIYICIIINAFLFASLFLIQSQTSDWQLTIGDFKQCFFISLIAAFIIWIIFRSIDFIFGGPLRRRIKLGYWP
jgi:hypothetical protein